MFRENLMTVKQRGSTTNLASSAKEAAPASRRATWLGFLKMGIVSIPVRTYGAVQEDPVSGLHLVHRKCGMRIQSPRKCPKHGELGAGEIARAAKDSSGRQVILSDDDLVKVRPATGRILELVRFIAPCDIDPVRYSGRHLYVLPDGPPADASFSLIRAALTRAGKVGIGELAMNGRQDTVVVAMREGRMTMHFLHGGSQIRQLSGQDYSSKSPPKVEVDVLGKFISGRNSTVDWSVFRDPTPQRMQELLDERLRPQKKGKASNRNRSGQSRTNPTSRTKAAAGTKRAVRERRP